MRNRKRKERKKNGRLQREGRRKGGHKAAGGRPIWTAAVHRGRRWGQGEGHQEGGELEGRAVDNEESDPTWRPR